MYVFVFCGEKTNTTPAWLVPSVLRSPFSFSFFLFCFFCFFLFLYPLPDCPTSRGGGGGDWTGLDSCCLSDRGAVVCVVNGYPAGLCLSDIHSDTGVVVVVVGREVSSCPGVREGRAGGFLDCQSVSNLYVPTLKQEGGSMGPRSW